jgi:hypothetical protein
MRAPTAAPSTTLTSFHLGGAEALSRRRIPLRN